MSFVVAELVARLRADTRQFRAEMRGATAEMRTTAQNMQRIGSTMNRKVTRPILLLGAATAAAAGNFEFSMKRVEAITGTTGAALESLEKQAKDLGRTTQFSAGQAADGMRFLGMAGFEATEILDSMPGVLDLAAAGNLDLATTADIASNVLTGFGKEASEATRLADIMAKTITTTNTDMMQLGQAMKFVAPVAASAGVTLEETSAAIGLLGNAGIQASMAGTTLRGAIAKLLSPTNEAKETMERLNLQVLDASGNLLPLVDIVRQLGDAGATTADLMTMFGLRAGPGMAALVSQGADALERQTKLMHEAGGTAQAIAEKQMEGLRGELLRLKAAAEGMAIALGDAGLLAALVAVAKFFTGVAQVVGALPKPIQTTVVALALLAAAAGPLIWMGGALVSAWGAIAGTWVGASVAAVGLSGTMALLASAAIAVGGALVVATKAVQAWNSEMNEAQSHGAEIVQPLIDGFDKAGASVGEFSGHINSMIDQYEKRMEAANNALNPFLKERHLAAARALEAEINHLMEIWNRAKELVDEGLGQEEALDQAVHEIAGAGAATAELEQSLIDLGMTEEEVAMLTEGMGDAFGEAATEAEDLQSVLFGFMDAQQAVADVQRDSAAAAEAYAAAQRNVADVAEDVALAQEEVNEVLSRTFDIAEATKDAIDAAMTSLIDGQRKAIDPVFEMIDALQAQKDLVNDLEKGTIGFGDEKTEIDITGSAAASAQEYASAAFDVEKAAIRLVGAIRRGDTSLAKVGQRLDALAAAGALSSEQAEALKKEIGNAIGTAEDMAGAAVDEAAAHELVAEKAEFEQEKAEDLDEAKDRLRDTVERLEDAERRAARAASDMSGSHRDAARAAHELNIEAGKLSDFLDDHPEAVQEAFEKYDLWYKQGLLPSAEAAADLKRDLAGAILEADKLAGKEVSVRVNAQASFGNIMDALPRSAEIELFMSDYNRRQWEEGWLHFIATGDSSQIPGLPAAPNLSGYQGMAVPGGRGTPVPAMLHGGEFVLSGDVVDAIKKGRPTLGADTSIKATASFSGGSGSSGGDTYITNQHFSVAIPETVARDMSERDLRRELKSLQFRAGAR